MTTLGRSSYEQLIKEDIERVLREMKHSPERDHVIAVLKFSIKALYEDPKPLKKLKEDKKELLVWLRERAEMYRKRARKPIDSISRAHRHAIAEELERVRAMVEKPPKRCVADCGKLDTGTCHCPEEVPND